MLNQRGKLALDLLVLPTLLVVPLPLLLAMVLENRKVVMVHANFRVRYRSGSDAAFPISPTFVSPVTDAGSFASIASFYVSSRQMALLLLPLLTI